ncbi:MAG: NAD(P)/FAD-dependent oxidoreductase [Proteobacteria bacterium]|nr:NAD(P)/FAD-dependent oxidoreductase [Pseudomonadota bacterium]
MAGGSVDLMVLGAGPAGMGAAIEAAKAGVSVAIADESPAPGGQVYRSFLSGMKVTDAAALGPDYAIGSGLKAELAASGARPAFGERVWFVAPGFRIESVGAGGVSRWDAKAVVAATGTSERVVPVPGWTTPGVMGLAAATILLKAQRMVPGERTVVAGCGPLVTAVAAGIIKGGGKVAAMVDLAGQVDWLKALPAMMARPDLLARGLGWQAKIRAAGVAVLHRHAVVEIRGGDRVREVVLCPVDENWRPIRGRERVIEADAVALGHGLIPGTEVTRLLRAEHRFVEDRGGWIATRDDDMRTTVERLYVAGDGAGISGAAAAELEGRLAGLAAARDLGRLSPSEYAAKAAPLKAKLAKAERFGIQMSKMMTPKPGLLDAVTPETVVCRCEDVTRAEIEETVKAGAFEVNQLKSWTRCGMGPCQGRICGDTAARLVAGHVGGRENAGSWTARVPIRPVQLDELAGEFTYEDIWANAPEPKPH